MTQSGQGEEPSARPAREGIVLPSDGGEPLLPGMPGTSGAGRPGGPAPAPPPPTTPAGGQAWDAPWGPDQQTPPAAEPGWTPPPAAQPWDTPQQQAPWTTPGPGTGVGEGTPPTSSYGGAAVQPGSTGYDGQGGGAGYGGQPGGFGQNGGAGYGGQPGGFGQNGGAGYGDRPGGFVQNGVAPQPNGGAGYGGQPGAPAQTGAAPLPPAGQGSPGAPLPPAGAAAYGRTGAGAGDGPVPGAPLPPAEGTAAGGRQDPATQYFPPVAAMSADEGATQYMPPVGPGALPPEMPAESTQLLRRAPQQSAHPHAGHAAPQPHPGQQPHGAPQPGAGPLPPAAVPHGAGAEATQFIAPVAGAQPAAHGENRQPPAEFDNLFRSEPGGGASSASATQQMPRFDQPGPPHATGHAPHGAPHAPYGRQDQENGGRGGRGGRTGSRVPLIAAIGVAIAVVGIGAGALLAGGDGDDDQSTENQPVSATSPAAEESPSAADPAQPQAVELDKLLADSGDSRTSVIKAVGDVKACRNLAGAAKDLRDAAKQREGLVTRLSGLSVDKLPDHAALTDALTKAWRASASADNHYAAWADQVAAKKGRCKKGEAFTTGQTAAGNRESGIASQQKVKAAELWNTIAKTYGLTQRQPTQL